MRILVLVLLASGLSIPAGAQRHRKSYAPPSDANRTGKVVIVGEPEARAAMLHKPTLADTLRQYRAFIAKVAAGYQANMKLSTAESGALSRSLEALGPELPTRYAIHFELDRWFKANTDPKRYEQWRQLDIYPEYQYAIMISEPVNTDK